MKEEKYISIGKITGLHGLHGNLKVYSYSNSLEPYESGCPIWLRNTAGVEKSYIIKTAKPYKKGVLITLEDVADINVAEKLVGSELLVSRELLPDLDDDEFYWFEIIGLQVFSKEGDFLGTVKSIFPTGSNDVYVVKKKGEEFLIPALESVVLSVDLDRHSMTVDLPEGL
jgi:16S rRNA processing protein RimM